MLDPLIDLGSAIDEVPGRIDPDHHRAVDVLWVHPRVDHRESGAGAIAEQVDALVVERDASGVDVGGLLLQRVAGEVDLGVGIEGLARLGIVQRLHIIVLDGERVRRAIFHVRILREWPQHLARIGVVSMIAGAVRSD